MVDVPPRVETSRPAEPRRRLAILTCMDARIDPLAVCGVELGDAHVIRNAGGRATDDALRSLALSSWILGTREVWVIHHTDCGLEEPEPGAARAQLRERSGGAADLETWAFTDLEESVREDVARISRSGLLPADATVRGFVVEVDTGQLRAVA